MLHFDINLTTYSLVLWWQRITCGEVECVRVALRNSTPTHHPHTFNTENSNITLRNTSETLALLIKLPTVLPRLLSYHSWIISPPLKPSCVILVRILLYGLPHTEHMSNYFSIDSNSDYLCACEEHFFCINHCVVCFP